VTRIVAAVATDPGRVRASNQDRAIVGDGFLAVADGMGGHVGGEIAARLAVEAVERSYAARPTADGLVAAVHKANEDIYTHGVRDQGLRGMGTTLTAAALVETGLGSQVVVASVGDSRAYLFGAGGLRQLTEDHSLVEEMVRRGEITEREAFFHPHRHILTRALGVDSQLDVDSWTIDVAEGDRILLCSDGLTNECPDDEIAEILAANADPDSAARALVVRALEHGGNDNVTVIVADVEGATSRDRQGVALRSAEAVRKDDQGVTGTESARAGFAVGADFVGGSPTRVRVPASPPRRRRPGERVVTPWSVLFVTALVGVLGGAAGFVGWFVKASYFVGFEHNRVAIFQGRPGGFLWFKPTLVRTTSLTRSSVYPASLPFLRAGLLEPSLSAAIGTVNTLMNEKHKLGLSAAAISVPSATTTGVASPTTPGST
jgi:protein phosphatase